MTRNTDRVTYHGSLTHLHGPAQVIGPCPCRQCHADWAAYLDHERPDHETPDVRWLLRRPGGDLLEHVRPESFTHRKATPPLPETP